MFWSEPYCPCDSAAKEWIERSLQWLSRQFPSNIFTGRPLVLPTDEFFAKKYEPSREAAQELLSQICRFMGVTETRVALKFIHEPTKVLFVNEDGDYLPPPAGTYRRSWQRYVISVDTDQLYAPADLIGTMAHELAHARLRGEGRIRPNRYDEELLTDLTAFSLGFAIFLANWPRAWISGFTKWPGTEFNKPAYMTAPMYGYALAHLAWFQGQPRPSWRKFLGSQVINDFKDACRYLFKTGNSLFKPGSITKSRQN
jgi:hypothetical protein